jgi:hypothetical protein
MKKTILILQTFMAFGFSAGIQTAKIPIEKGWKKIGIKEVGTIELPITFEIDKSKYKRNTVEGISVYTDQNLIAETKMAKGTKHAQVVFDTFVGESGDFGKLGSNFNNITAKGLEDLDKLEKNALVKGGYNGKIIEFRPNKVLQINGMSCLCYSYIRQLEGKPAERVTIYFFHNNDRSHQINFYCNASDANYWKADCSKIINSFKITNVR